MRIPGLVEIQPGSMVMGCSQEPEYFPRIAMEITGTFQIMPLLVTQGEWQAVMGTQPWMEAETHYEKMLGELPFGFALPAINLTQVEAAKYAARLSTQCGIPLSLVPEVCWEYACRGGSAGDYWWGDDLEAGRSFEWLDWGDETPVVKAPGQLQANPFGLFDMAGNVNELILDRVPASDSFFVPKSHYATSRNFVGRAGDFTVLRSANVMDAALSARSGGKIINHSSSPQMFAGFRLAHVPWLS